MEDNLTQTNVGDNLEPVYYYRFQEISYAPPLDEFENPVGEGGVIIELQTYLVTKKTPKGVKIRRAYKTSKGGGGQRVAYSNVEKQVTNTHIKRYAHPTIEEAKEAFIARKKKEKSIYDARSRKMTKLLKMIMEGKYESYT